MKRISKFCRCWYLLQLRERVLPPSTKQRREKMKVQLIRRRLGGKSQIESSSTHLIYRSVESRGRLMLLLVQMLLLVLDELRLTSPSPVCWDGLREQLERSLCAAAGRVHRRDGDILRRRAGRPRHGGAGDGRRALLFHDATRKAQLFERLANHVVGKSLITVLTCTTSVRAYA